MLVLVLARQQVLEQLVLEQQLALVQVLEQLLKLKLEQVLEQPQQSRHHSLEQQLLVSRRCHASTKNHRRFSIAGCQRCCASCRCWWLNLLQTLSPRRLLLPTTLPLYLVFSFVSSEISLQQRCVSYTFCVPSHNPLSFIVPQQ